MADDDQTIHDAVLEEFGVKDAIRDAISESQRLFDLGFQQDEFGQFHATDCRVTLYRVGEEWGCLTEPLDG